MVYHIGDAGEQHTKALARYKNKAMNSLQRSSMEDMFNPTEAQASGADFDASSEKTPANPDRLVGIAQLLNKSMDPGDDGSIMSFKYKDGDGRATVTSPGGRVTKRAGDGRHPDARKQGLIERSSAFSPSGGRRHASYEQANYYDCHQTGSANTAAAVAAATTAATGRQSSRFAGGEKRKASYVAANHALQRVGSRSHIAAGETGARGPLLMGGAQSISDYSSKEGSPEPSPYYLASAPAPSWETRPQGIRAGRVVEAVKAGGAIASVRGIPIKMATFGGYDARQNSYNSAIGVRTKTRTSTPESC